MAFVFGSRLYGKVDVVPGLFHVATKFYHFDYIPLIPVEGWLVLQEKGNGWRGQRVNVQGKSMLVAWLRTGLVVVGVAAGIGGAVALSENASQVAVPIFMIPVLCAGGLWWTYKSSVIMRPRYEQAVAYADQLGLNPIGHVMLEVACGKMTKEDGDQLIAKLRRPAAPAQCPEVIELAEARPAIDELEVVDQPQGRGVHPTLDPQAFPEMPEESDAPLPLAGPLPNQPQISDPANRQRQRTR